MSYYINGKAMRLCDASGNPVKNSDAYFHAFANMSEEIESMHFYRNGVQCKVGKVPSSKHTPFCVVRNNRAINVAFFGDYKEIPNFAIQNKRGKFVVQKSDKVITINKGKEDMFPMHELRVNSENSIFISNPISELIEKMASTNVAGLTVILTDQTSIRRDMTGVTVTSPDGDSVWKLGDERFELSEEDLDALVDSVEETHSDRRPESPNNVDDYYDIPDIEDLLVYQ